MRIAFLVNQGQHLDAHQTTTLLIGAAIRRGHEVLVCGVGDLSLGEDGQTMVTCCKVSESEPSALTAELAMNDVSSDTLDSQDLCIVRTNPSRDTARRAYHVAALRLLEGLEERGIRIVNRPRGLSRAQTKLSLLDFPRELRPSTLVTRDATLIEQFVERQPGRAVIKPLEGTRGRDVFVLESTGSRANRKQIIDVVLRQGYAVVQEFAPGAENGDVRVTVVNGRILAVGGKSAAIARVPGVHDFRSNLHAGGSPKRTEVTSEMGDAVARIAPLLEREGLFHVGVDFVGDKILEVNVFSPGGLFPSERLYERDFSGAVIQALESEG